MHLPTFARSPATEEFHRTLFEDHVEEIAFLYEQRLASSEQPSRTWQGVADLEERIEAHIDALVVGRQLALDVCAELAAEGDPGVLFAATSVFCRREQAPAVAQLLKALDPENPAQRDAMRLALCFELPASWAGFVTKALMGRDPVLATMLAGVCAYRRLPVADELCALAQHLRPVPVELLDALGQLRVRAARPVLEASLDDANPAVRSAALLALCRLGAQTPLRQLHAAASHHAWPRLSLAIAADRAGLDVLLELARSDTIDGDGLDALGMIGSPAALSALHHTLKQEEQAPRSARALHWITGADLFEEAFVPEPVQEDELTADELDAWRTKQQAPQHPDGRPFGEKVRRLSCDPARWMQWLTAHAARFDPALRYAFGEPCTPAGLAQHLADARADFRWRELAAQQLAVRYGCNVPFEINMPVAHQLRALQEMSSWAVAANARFQSGHWYFHGRLQD